MSRAKMIFEDLTKGGMATRVEAGDRVSIRSRRVLARIEAHYGDRPSRPTLMTMTSKVGASIDGEWLLR